MEESAPKRRRTSPRTSVPVHPANEEAVTRTSDDHAATASAIPDRSRPSFASPTRASLARSNPDILDRQRSRPSVRDGAVHENQTNRRSEAEPANSQPPTRSSGSQGRSKLQEMLAQKAHAARLRDGETPTQPSQDDQPSSTGTPSKNPARRIGGSMGGMPRRSPQKPVSRPLPPPDDDEEEDGAFDGVQNPFMGRRLDRSPPAGADTQQNAQNNEQAGEDDRPQAPVPEPELPPTPAERGEKDPVVTTPPDGIHDTPSRRRRSDKGMRSSPLKAPPLTRPDESETSEHLIKKRKRAAARRAAEKEVEPEAADTGATGEEQGPHRARHVEPADAFPEKSSLRDKLKAQVEQLRADLDFVTKENNRIRQETRRRSTRQTQAAAGMPPSAEELAAVLSRSLLPKSKQKKSQHQQLDSSQRLLDAALNPATWFSFGSATPMASALKSTPARRQQEQAEKPPTSHLPVSMTAEEQLPFLQAFTPFSFKSDTFIVEATEENKAAQKEGAQTLPLLRQHNISISSASPPGLFAAKLEMVVDTSALRITELDVPKLDPAAISELGPFIEKTCSSPSRNVSIICWAMSEWYRIAVERARLWCSLAHVVRDREKFVEVVRDARSRRRKKKSRKEQAEDEHDEPSISDIASKDGFTRAAILSHMGRTAFEVPIPQDGVDDAKWACLRVQWKIEFDWTGEGLSRVGVLIGAPGKWHEADEGGALNKIQKLFADLVKGDQNPSMAVRTIISLLAGDMSTR